MVNPKEIKNEIVMSEQMIQIDGVHQTTLVEERRFNPEGLMEHQYIPLGTVQVQQKIVNDLIYITDYWSVERWWRVFINPHTYELLMSKFLQGRTVAIDYREKNNPKVFIPKDTKVDGFTSFFQEHTEAFKTMTGEELSYTLESLGYDEAEGVFYASKLDKRY